MSAFDLATPSGILGVAGSAARALGSLSFLLLLWWPFVLAAFVGAWLALERAGQRGWASLVPGYNGVVFLRAAGQRWWWLLLLCVPGVNVVAWAVCCLRFARAYGKGRAFGAGLALAPPVFMAVLGLSGAPHLRSRVRRWTGPKLALVPAPAAGEPCLSPPHRRRTSW